MANGGTDDAERTEEPTQRRREEARREGRIPRSQELTTAVLLLGSAMVLSVMGPSLARSMTAAFGYGLTAAGTPLDAAGALALLRGFGRYVLGALASTLLAIAAIALAINLAQARGVVSTAPLSLKWERINPLANGRRLVGTHGLAELLRQLVKLLIVGVAIHISLSAAWSDIVALGQQPPIALLHLCKRYALRLLVTAGLAYLALALADYLYQLWQYEKELRMTKAELKQELRQSEGDPLVKQRMRSMARGFARRQMFRDVPKADVIIANPTHVAVALKYDPLEAPAPLVLAMGQRKVAERIKAIAMEHGVPVIENRPLARALLASAKVGGMIPAELYAAVAEILAFVLRRRAERGATWQQSPDV